MQQPNTGAATPPVDDYKRWVQGELAAIARTISKVRPVTGRQLYSLADAVGPTHASVDDWAYVDLFAAFPANELARLTRMAQFTGNVRLFIGKLRSLVVFLPLVFTWFFLYRSGGNLNVFMQDLPVAALINIGLFALMAFFTFILAGNGNGPAASAYESHIQEVLRAASVILVRMRATLPIEYVHTMKVTGEQFMNQSRQLMEEFVRYRNRLDSITASQEMQLRGAEQLVDKALTGMDRMSTASNLIGNAIGTVQTTLNQLQTDLANVSKVVDAAKTTQSDSARILGGVLSQQSSSLAMLQTTIQELKGNVALLKAAMDSSTPAIQNVAQAADGMRNVHKTFIQELARPLQQYHATSLAMETSSRSIDSATQAISRGQGQMPTMVSSINDSINEMASRMRSLEAALLRLSESNAAVNQQLVTNQQSLLRSLDSVASAISRSQTTR